MMRVVRGQETWVETIALKKKLGASESGRRLLKQLQDAGEPLTAARAFKVLKAQPTQIVGENAEGDAIQIAKADKHNLGAMLKELHEERLRDRPMSKTDCLAMLKYCSDVDPNLASRILQETSPSPQVETPEFLKDVRDRCESSGNFIGLGEQIQPPQHPLDLMNRVYRHLEIESHPKALPPGARKGSDIILFSHDSVPGRVTKTAIIQFAGRRTIERGRMALAQARAFAAEFYRGGKPVPCRVASMWGKFSRDKAKFHIWCGTLSGDELLLHMEERPVSLIWRRDAPLIDNGLLKRLLWLTETSPLDAVKPPGSIPIEEIPEDEEDFQYSNSDDGVSSDDDNPNPYNT